MSDLSTLPGADNPPVSFTVIPTEDAVEHNIEPRDRPLGAHATLAEFAQKTEKGFDFNGTDYGMSVGRSLFMLELFHPGLYDDEIKAQGLDPVNLVALVARDPEDGTVQSIEELWAATAEGEVNLGEVKFTRVR